MCSLRPRRSCTLPPASPDDLDTLLDHLYDCTDEEILKECKTVSKYYKNDIEQIAKFWLLDTESYNLQNDRHIYLLRWIFETVGLKHLLVVDYLHSLSKQTVRRLGLVRVIIPNRIYYRNRTGCHTYDTDEDVEMH